MSSLNYKDYIYKMQRDRYKVFLSQDHEKGQFDVKFVIQGKEIYANKFILMPVSEPMAAMLSERWSAKDEPINVQTYSFDCFYEFLLFLYIGNCKLTNENIREMVDLAEFYAILCLKDFCDNFLSRLEFAPENIEEWYDFAQQYSLPFFTESIKKYINAKGDSIIRECNFLCFKKPFIQFFSTALNGNFKEEFFEAVCNWVEHHAKKLPDVNDSNINLQDVVKAEINVIIPVSDFYKMKFKFLMDFVVEHGFFVSPSEYFLAQENIKSYNRSNKAPFQCAYELAEKQALKKQSIAAKNSENFDVADSIQADLVKIMPHLKFHEMDMEFLNNFVVEKGFILSPTELYRSFQYGNYGSSQNFKLIYEIAEKQALQKQKISSDPDNFNLATSIKADLANVMPHVHFQYMKKEILLDFVLEKGFLLSPSELAEFLDFSNQLNKMNEQQNLTSKLLLVYELAQRQALKKQMMSQDDEIFNVTDSIKADMAEVIRLIKFYHFDKRFLTNFVVANGFLSKEQASHVFDTRVVVKNGDKAITGFFVDYYGIRRKFDHGSDTKRTKDKKIRLCKVKCRIPKTPSKVTKMKGVKWYLCLEKDGVFTIKYHKLIDRSDYLIAQMENNDEFQLEGQIKISFSDNV